MYGQFSKQYKLQTQQTLRIMNLERFAALVF